MVKYSQMKLVSVLLLLQAVLSPVFAEGRVEVSAQPPSQYADTESVTNIVFDAGSADARLFSLSLELDATPSNNVSVVFGCDANDNGVLERQEADAVVGWDSGFWFYQDRRVGVEEHVSRASSHRRLDWHLTLDSRKTAKSLVSSDNDGTVFANAIPATMFDANWNLMQVTSRGLSEPNGVVATEANSWGFNVRVR